ncbi:MAG TPA: dihydrodipicolinate synthase family protein [Burkholderiaceae bacterium]|jgi:4-hydroxy-tetrahydrodipicolinate synthase|nr:dihydrodipicolinate synthase family protein [Burkholderiaceae bacterium]
MADLKITGVYCAAVTPVTDDLAPDHAAFVAHCRRLLNDGCDGIAMLGTTGEANSFSSAERKTLLEAVITGGVRPERLLPGTGVAALTETVELTRHALSLGVNRVVMLPPFYYKGISEDGLFASYAEVVERIGDARLQVVLYHIPQFSAVPITFPVIARLRARYSSVFVGLKDSAGEMSNMVALVDEFPGFAVLAGADPLMLPLLRKGGAGCITATSNLIARDLAFIFRHYADPARAADVEAAQARVVAMRSRVSKFAQIASIKALIAGQTGHVSWRKLRPPLLALNDAEIDQL